MILSSKKVLMAFITIVFAFVLIIFQNINNLILDSHSNIVIVFLGAIIIHIVILSEIFMRKKKIDLFMLFVLMNFFFVFGRHMLYVLGVISYSQAFTKLISINSIIQASYWNIYCILAMYIGYLFVLDDFTSNSKLKTEYDSELMRKSMRITAIIFTMISIYPQIKIQLNNIEFTRVYGYAYRILEINKEASINGVIGGFFMPSIVAWIVSRNKKEKLPIIILFSYFGVYLLTGSRITIVCTIFVLFYFYIRKNGIGLKKIVVISIVGFFLLSVFSMLSKERNALIDRQQSVWDYILKDNVLVDSINEAGGTFRVSAVVIDHCPTEVNHAHGLTYLYSLVYIIPNSISSFFVPNIPDTDTVFSPFLIRYGGIGSSFSAEAYYNFGYLGVIALFLFGLLWGRISQKIDKAIESERVLLIFWYIQLVQAVIFTVRSDLMYRIRPLVWWTIPIIVISMIVYNSTIQKQKYIV